MKKFRKFIVAIILVTCLSSMAVISVSADEYDFRDKSTWETVGYGYTTSGGFVGAVQADLWASGYPVTTGTVDELYGSKTNQAVRYFQNRYGLSADGIVGPKTWDKFEQFTYNRPGNGRIYAHSGSTRYEVEYYEIDNFNGEIHVVGFLNNSREGSTVESVTVYSY